MLGHDAKLNALDFLGRILHDDLLALRDITEEDDKEIEASKYDLNYIALDGQVEMLRDPQGTLDVRAVAARDAARERGLEVGCFRPPSVPAGTSRLRLTARADLSDADVSRAEAILRDVVEEFSHL